MPTTQLLIRVQARGGKFLGPDINYAYVWIVAEDGNVLAHGLAGSKAEPMDSGNLSPTISVAASTGVVLTYGTDTTKPPQPWYLTANPGKTAFFNKPFELDKPQMLEIVVSGCDENGDPTGATSSGSMWVTPGLTLTDEPGFIVEIPGLAVSIIAVKPDQNGATVSAKVTMMCGCPINPLGAGVPWPDNEFVVTAEVWAHGKLAESVPMSLQKTSTYTAWVPLANARGASDAELRITALQKTAANYGFASRALSS